MPDYFCIGATPAYEPCAQVGTEGYREKALAECRRFRDLLRRVIGPEPEGAVLKIKGFPHDFGTYYELVCEFDTGNAAARAYALRCEDEAPATWEG